LHANATAVPHPLVRRTFVPSQQYQQLRIMKRLFLKIFDQQKKFFFSGDKDIETNNSALQIRSTVCLAADQ